MTKTARSAFPAELPPGLETEVKFSASPAGLDALLSMHFAGAAGFGPRRTVTSTYFDTASGALRAAGLVLRVRRAGGRLHLGVKWSLPDQGLFARGEHETPTASDEPDIAALGPDLAVIIADAADGEALAPLFTTRVSRRTRLVRHAGATVEVAIDTGSIVAPSGSVALRECEFELRDGPPDALFDLADTVCEQCAFMLEPLSKGERGYRLALGISPPTVKTPLAVPDATPTLDDAIAVLLGACLAQFQGNWPAYQDGDSVTSLHQMRVALRRMRAVLGLFNRAVPSPAFDRVRDQARSIASVLGEARNWDVITAMLLQGPVVAFPLASGMATLMDAVDRRRAADDEQVRALLRDPATSRFVLAVDGLVARRGWRAGLPGPELALLDAEPHPFARECLARLHRRVRRAGKGIEDLDDAGLHRLRIALKKLHYAADAFGPLFGRRRAAARFSASAAEAQDVLGVANDAAILLDAVRRLDLPAGQAEAAEARGLALGWFARGAAMNRRQAVEAFRAFEDCDRFWT